MRNLIILGVALLLTACGTDRTYVDKPGSGSPSFGSDPAANDLKLNSEKEYHPSKNTNGKYEVPEGTNFIEIVLPETIAVLSGNAGNYYTIVYIDDFRCFYQGGSNFSYPLQMGNQSEVEKGEKYHFSHCTNSSGTMDLEAGDQVLVEDGVEVEIHNGDSTETTLIQTVIEVLD